MATTKNPPQAAAKLSKAAVVERALALADELGLEALTIRRLAQELGVTPMALYWHFRSKEELLAGLGDRVWAEIDVDIDPAADWPAQLRGLLESLVAMLRAHPSASQLLLAGEKMHGEASIMATETALAVLRRGGFDPEQASEIARSAMWTGLTLVMSEPGYNPAGTPEERTELMRRSRIRLAMLPPDRFPRVVESAGPLTACDYPDFHYQFGIDLFIAGVVAVSANPRSPRPSTAS
ncbi:MAG TPA: TetR family transcriptional regulator [Streptosporangiaceae bacterium]|nr:TetR family transcriptional regulator [Streptosporangiaceae bacterium]